MKSLIDNWISFIIYVVMIFMIASAGVTEMQIMTARHIHTSVINQIQSSYYMVDIDAMNDKLHETYPSWQIESTVINTVNNRQDRLVTLHYKVIQPLFGIEKEGQIDGYAR